MKKKKKKAKLCEKQLQEEKPKSQLERDRKLKRVGSPSKASKGRRGKGGVAGRRARAIEKERAPIEMDESALVDDHTTCDISSISRGQTQEFTPGASGMTYQPTNIDINTPSFSSSPGLPMSIKTSDVVNNLEDSNINIESNELDDSNDEVENASECGEPSVKEKRKFFLSVVGMGVTIFTSMTKRNEQRETKNCN
ncbi:hypothetical protein H5410_013330 [Solanum commersonii]|uniref:Uncharacterized protein n=1 Tax=Solanum commersonii TaxID=4109 RepID=A0A9J6AUA1_SOLCO|nr:hypothetical protein H5410_013330 [Solanum commersonii]